MGEARTCHWCGRTITGWCDQCRIAIQSWPMAAKMTLRERMMELTWFLEGDGKYCEVPFWNIQQRIEELMQRPVWTHELGDTDHLIEELKGQMRHGTGDELQAHAQGNRIVQRRTRHDHGTGVRRGQV